MPRKAESQDPWDAGQAEEPDKPQVRRMPERLEDLTLDAPFEGWKFTANRNYTMHELEELLSGFYYRMREVLMKLVKSWDFVDREGNPLTLDQTGWDETTVDLIIAMRDKATGMNTVPNR